MIKKSLYLWSQMQSFRPTDEFLFLYFSTTDPPQIHTLKCRIPTPISLGLIHAGTRKNQSLLSILLSVAGCASREIIRSFEGSGGCVCVCVLCERGCFPEGGLTQKNSKYLRSLISYFWVSADTFRQKQPSHEK